MRPLSQLIVYYDFDAAERMRLPRTITYGGVYRVASPVDRFPMAVSASCLPPWDHVTIHRGDRFPTHEEIDCVRRLFFLEHETPYQIHSQAQMTTGMTLHLWRHQSAPVPTPPAWMLAPTKAH